MTTRWPVLGLLLLLAGCATIRGDPRLPPLPFAAVQDIPWAGATISPFGCQGEIGAMWVTADRTYQIFLFGDHAIIVDARPGEELPVWFARILADKTFLLEFVLSFREAITRYPEVCDYFRPPVPAPATLRVERGSFQPLSMWTRLIP